MNKRHAYTLPSQQQLEAIKPGDRLVYLSDDYGADHQYALVTADSHFDERDAAANRMIDFKFEDGVFGSAFDDEIGLPADVQMADPSTATLADIQQERIAMIQAGPNPLPMASPMADTVRDRRAEIAVQVDTSVVEAVVDRFSRALDEVREDRNTAMDQLTLAREEILRLSSSLAEAREQRTNADVSNVKLGAELAETREQLARANEAAEPIAQRWEPVLEGQTLERGAVVRAASYIGSVPPGTEGRVILSWDFGRYPHGVIFAGSTTATHAAPGELEVQA